MVWVSIVVAVMAVVAVVAVMGFDLGVPISAVAGGC
jgi:hypothetical protein